MAQELSANTLLDSRYKIKKTLSFTEAGGIYEAEDLTEKSSILIKEIIPPSSLTDDQIEKKVEGFNEILLILTQFDHTNLCKIYGHFTENRRQYVVMEKVNGISLDSLISMSVKPISEKQTLLWGKQICAAMHYLHNRPKPFIFDVLDTTHIMIDTQEHLKLINYGLDRFFVDDNAISFTADRGFIAQEMKRLGETLYFMISREKVTSFGVTPDDNISEKMAALLNKLLSGDPDRTFKSFEEIANNLELILNPPPEIKKDTSSSKPLFKIIDFGRLWQTCLDKVLGQPIWLLVTEIIGILAVIGAMMYILNPPVPARTGEAAYIACGKELLMTDIASGKIYRLKMPGAINCLASAQNGAKLYAGSGEADCVYILNSKNNKNIGSFAVSAIPDKLVTDPTENWLYVLQSKEGHISFVQIDKSPVPEAPSSGAKQIKEAVCGIYTIGHEAKGLAAASVSRPSEDSKKKKKSDEVEAPKTDFDNVVHRIYCSSSTTSDLVGITYPPVEEFAESILPAAGPVALNSTCTKLYAVQSTSSQIAAFNADTIKQEALISQTGGSDVSQLLVSPDDKFVWSLNKTGSLGIIGTDTNKFVSSVKVAGKPVSACWRNTESGPELWVVSQSPNQISIIDAAKHSLKKVINLPGPAPRDICILPAPSGQ